LQKRDRFNEKSAVLRISVFGKTFTWSGEKRWEGAVVRGMRRGK